MTTRNDWIQTFTGKQFFPLEPENVDIVDIAHSLSMVCRFNGHCSKFYSVAEHSLRVSYLVPKKFALWGLLHDATEAYIGDIFRPINRIMWYSNDKESFLPLDEIENHIMKLIATTFLLPWPTPREVLHADMIMLATEKRDLMSSEPSEWMPMPSPSDQKILDTLTPDEAEECFLDRFHTLISFRNINV